MARLFTRQLAEQGAAVCNGDTAHLKRAELLTGRVILRALDTPDATDVQINYSFDRGRCTDFELTEAPAPAPFRDAPFVPVKDGLARVTANYQTWTRLDKGAIEPADALKSDDYHIEANMLLLVPLMQAVNSWTEKIRALPKTYD